MTTSKSTLSAPDYIASEPAEKIAVFAATKEHAESLSKDISTMYVAALGQGGVGKSGCEAYPDPDLFTEEGIKSTLLGEERLIAVAKYNDEICGAMVADKLSPYHVEFNSMAVRLDKRGLGIGSAIVSGLKEMMDDSDLTINTTELVTHSLASQAAHFQAGYRFIVGFAFCHYPRVFFANHPESVLWVSRFQGKLVSAVKQIRSALGRKLGTITSDLVQTVVSAQAQGRFSTGQRLSEKQLQLAAELLLERTAYVPLAYNNIVQSILFQFEDILDRTVVSNFIAPESTEVTESEKSEAPLVEEKDGFGHAYIIYKPGFNFDQAVIEQALSSLEQLKKRYILVRIPANQPEAIILADYLRQQKDFVFHSYLPLYGYNLNQDQNQENFHDVLTLQWIAPAVLAENALPGQTESVVKIYGYPENLSGSIVKLIASELQKNEQPKE